MKRIIFCSFLFMVGLRSFGEKTPEIATIGVYVINISELNLSDNSFHADFYLWCRWKGPIDPLKNIEFTNLQEQWNFSDTDLLTAPIPLKDSFFYNSFHIIGQFTHNFKLHNYPFDKQKISIHLRNSIYTSRELVYAADKINSKVDENIIIPGWNMGQFESETRRHKYSSNFGLPENIGNDTYNNVSFSITLSRPVQYFFWKLLLPIMVVLLSSFGSTLIHPKYIDARIYAPIGALLTTVFLEQSYSSKLPDISYLILLDKIYITVYIFILGGIFHAIYTANLVNDGSEESFARAKRLDKIYIRVVAVVLLLAPLLFLF